jgi:purine catabolism regulator
VAIIRLPVDGAVQDVDLGAAERLATAVRKVAEGAAVTVREATVVAIVPEADRDAARDPAAQQTAWASALAGSTGATAGLSELVDQPEAAPRGYRQAELAIELGIRLGRAGQTVRYDDLGIYRLLFDIGDMRQLLRFAHEVIGPLLTHDRRHTVDLVQTLSVYLAQHGSLKQTARILGLHANTVAYRAQRIQALTGLDLADADDRLLAHVAVKIVEAQLTPHEQRTVEPLVPRGSRADAPPHAPAGGSAGGSAAAGR